MPFDQLMGRVSNSVAFSIFNLMFEVFVAKDAVSWAGHSMPYKHRQYN
jgi:hypothetical protein